MYVGDVICLCSPWANPIYSRCRWREHLRAPTILCAICAGVSLDYETNTGWWFGTFFFPDIGNNLPNWLLFFFQRGWWDKILIYAAYGMQPAQPMRRLKETGEKNAQSNHITTYHHWIGSSCYSWSLFLVTFLPAAESKRWGESAFTGQCGKRGCCGRGLPWAVPTSQMGQQDFAQMIPGGGKLGRHNQKDPEVWRKFVTCRSVFINMGYRSTERGEREGNYCIHIFYVSIRPVCVCGHTSSNFNNQLVIADMVISHSLLVNLTDSHQ